MSHAQICATQLLDQSHISHELMIAQYLIIAQYLMIIAQYLIFVSSSKINLQEVLFSEKVIYHQFMQFTLCSLLVKVT